MVGVQADRSDVGPGGEPPANDPLAKHIAIVDPRPTYATLSDRADAELAAYTKVMDEHPGTGAAILGRLGKAGAFLDKGDADAALSLFNDVLLTDLAKADIDVRARATEGKGFAYELKKDYDAALAAFRDLEAVDKSMEDLGKYHQGRMLVKKGDKDKAKEILLALYKKLELPSVDGPPTKELKAAVEQYLRMVDPTAVPKRQKTPTQQEMMQQIQEQMAKMKGGGDDGGEEMPDVPEMPEPPPIQVPLPPQEAPPPGDNDDGTH